jgi:uncharacterized membrane protein
MALPTDPAVKRLMGMLGVSGVLHFAIPKQYERIVPPGLGDARMLVLASGAAELACAGLLAAPKTRRIGALLSAGLFVAVFPANVYSVKVLGTNKASRAGAIARLPLQIPMIRSALKVARES